MDMECIFFNANANFNNANYQTIAFIDNHSSKKENSLAQLTFIDNLFSVYKIVSMKVTFFSVT